MRRSRLGDVHLLVNIIYIVAHCEFGRFAHRIRFHRCLSQQIGGANDNLTMRHRRAECAIALLLVLCAGAAVAAVQTCDIQGDPVNPNNGNTTQGKTGIMRCRDGAHGVLQREQEIRDGKFMGAVRLYRDGVLEREHRVNERGNRDGVSREFAPPAALGGKPVLVAEETLRDGRTVGLVRRWYSTGVLRRVSFHDDGDREIAMAAFNPDSRLAELRCASRPVLGPDFDDATACGFAGDATVSAYASKGWVEQRTTYRGGVAVRSEALWENGSTRELQEKNSEGGSTKSFSADGTLRREKQWQDAGERRRVQTLDREFHESGKRTRERRWRVVEQRGERVGELAADDAWYLNGQPRQRIAYEGSGAAMLRTETQFHDNGTLAEEGTWAIGGGGGAARGLRGDRPIGTHRSFDAEGHVRVESTFDERGRLTRERLLDASGQVLRDHEVFEDGSRKSTARGRGVGT